MLRLARCHLLARFLAPILALILTLLALRLAHLARLRGPLA
eukprot:CAMPEP_0118825264 /NCGR_PEP_ID=MMETSP1162-20130426/11187_1 /TAXON_ID=33656 /ORGANISM="Phaeocystis Sp, Strain CCMP2710" /LENGTH=40 /DNA_ID= /DNA_START= /DNA_END= /DNA_ORIENTATION=